MLAWMIYAALVAIAFSAAALITEQATKARRLPTRWPWLIAIVASLLLPVAMATVSLRFPGHITPAAVAAPLALRDTTSIPLASAVIDWSGTSTYTSSTSINTLLKDIWLATSFTLMLFVGAGTALFHRRKRGWAEGHLCGVPVFVSDSVGPAVVGLMRSRIVVPTWVMQESPDQQHYVMAHEQSHLEARDPLLVALSLILLMAMPWNPFLWWQFHRLRCAIEVDCDARVLQAGGDIGDYCETLIQVGQNQSEFIGSVTAMSESRTFLERRIRIMLSKPKKWAGAFAFVLISIALGVAAFAAQVTPPATPVPTASNAISVNPALLDTYVGDYEISDTSMITVRRKGDGLTVSPIGQLAAAGTIDAPAISATQFSVPPVDATLDFVNGANHQVSSMIVRVHGVLYVNAPRVDAARAAYIRDALAGRVRNQTPYPDSENVLRRALDPDNTTGIRPEAQMSDLQRISLKAYFAKLGPVQSYRFNGVTDYGWDSYDVQHQNGAEQVFFLVDEQGLIVSSVVRRQ